RHQRISITAWILSLFYASRRRHTRSKRDWSSDVCSSDLMRESVLIGHGLQPFRFTDGIVGIEPDVEMNRLDNVLVLAIGKEILRSEERREGKSVKLGGSRNIRKTNEI